MRVKAELTETILGRVILAHLTKIVVGLGAILAFVWQARGDAELIKQAINANSTKIAFMEAVAASWRTEHIRDHTELNQTLRRIETKTDTLLIKVTTDRGIKAYED